MRCSIDQWGCKELHASPSQIAFLVAIAFQPIQSKQKEIFSSGFYPLLQRKISLLSQLINSQLNLTKAWLLYAMSFTRATLNIFPNSSLKTTDFFSFFFFKLKIWVFQTMAFPIGTIRFCGSNVVSVSFSC